MLIDEERQQLRKEAEQFLVAECNKPGLSKKVAEKLYPMLIERGFVPEQLGNCRVLGAELGIEQRWLAFREPLPDEVRENIDRNVDGLEFELLAKVRRIDDRTWCDFISFHIPIGQDADLKYRQFWDSFGTDISDSDREKIRKDGAALAKPKRLPSEKIERDLKQKCKAVQVRYPHLARVVPQT